MERYKKIMSYPRSSAHHKATSVRVRTVMRNINLFKREGDLERAKRLEALIDELYES